MTMPALVMPSSAPAAPPADGPQSLYLHSSQARSWRFGKAQLSEMRKDGVAQAHKRLEQAWARERSLSAVEGEPEASSSSTPIDTLSVEEELALVTYYLTRVRQLVKAFALPELVEATAVTFIKRFYLRNTCMDYHPKNIMLTCLFLAAKAESHAVPLRHFATKLAGKHASQETIADYKKNIQDHEFLVSQSLAFEYMVHGAHRALHGVFLDVQKTLDPAPSNDTMQELLQPARSSLQASRLTEAEFLYTPGQIALTSISAASGEGAALVDRYVEAKERRRLEAKARVQETRKQWTERQLAGKRNGKDEDAMKYIDKTSEVQDDSTYLDATELKGAIQQIIDMIGSQQEKGSGDLDKVKEIDKKLKLVQNPEMLPNSRTAKHRLQSQEEVRLGKRDAAAARKVENDPFNDEDEDPIKPATKKAKTQA